MWGKQMLVNGKPLIVVDLDDNIGDFANMLVYSLNYHFGKNLRKSDLVDFHGITDLYGITMDQFFEVIIDDHLMESCAPIPGSREAMIRLVKDHYVVIMTARDYDPEAYQKTSLWLTQHKIPCHQLIVTKKGQTKADAINDYFGVAPVAFFDDAAHNIKNVGNAFPNALLFMPEQPWNEYRFGDFPGVHSMQSFRHAVSYYYDNYVAGGVDERARDREAKAVHGNEPSGCNA